MHGEEAGGTIRANWRGTPVDRQHPLFGLRDEELEFVMRMVLASGSLKELARAYGVSYPTIRARLDRLIDRLEAIRQDKPADPMANLLADLVEQGHMMPAAARRVLELHRESTNENGGSGDG